MYSDLKPRLILASGSPRRSEILKALGLEFEVMIPEPGAEPECLHAREELSGSEKDGGDGEKDGERYEALVRSVCGVCANVNLQLSDAGEAYTLRDCIAEAERSALAKALNAAERLPEGRPGAAPLICLGADTMVVHGRDVLGKPDSAEDALAMLKELSGSWHHVVTGAAAVKLPERISLTSCAVTAVRFRDLSEEELRAYIRTGHPMDKAGAYGIQELGSLFAERIDGCYFNVVGLPVTVVNALLGKFGWDILHLRKN